VSTSLIASSLEGHSLKESLLSESRFELTSGSKDATNLTAAWLLVAAKPTGSSNEKIYITKVSHIYLPA
jgi:hypothetical protein